MGVPWDGGRRDATAVDRCMSPVRLRRAARACAARRADEGPRRRDEDGPGAPGRRGAGDGTRSRQAGRRPTRDTAGGPFERAR